MTSNCSSAYPRSMGPIIGDAFPNLQGETQDTSDFNLYDHMGDSWGIVFTHPADFTPVCTTEIGAAQSLMGEFQMRNIKICGFSCDDSSTHREWISDVEAATGNRVTFPLFCDSTRTHAVELGVLDPTSKDVDGMPLTLRGVYILNPQKVIALTMMYPACVGRNFDEILRSVDALQRAAKFSVATPANWNPGDKTIVPPDMDDDTATSVFGKNGFVTVKLPSEKGKSLSTHCLRYTDDPVLTNKNENKQLFNLASTMGRNTFSWRPPKSFAKLSNKKQRDQKEGTDKTNNSSRKPSRDNSRGIGISKSLTWNLFNRNLTQLKEETDQVMTYRRRALRSSLPPGNSSGMIIDFKTRDDHDVVRKSSKLSRSLPPRRNTSLTVDSEDEEEKLDDSIVW